MSNDKRLIAIIEDNHDDQLFLMELLEEVGVENPLLLFRDGEEALEYLQPDFGRPRLPSLILLDLMMKRTDGFTVLSQLKSHPLTQAIPVIVLTSITDPKAIRKCYDLYASSVLPKGENLKVYREVITVMADYWLKHAVLPNEPTNRIQGHTNVYDIRRRHLR